MGERRRRAGAAGPGWVVVLVALAGPGRALRGGHRRRRPRQRPRPGSVDGCGARPVEPHRIRDGAGRPVGHRAARPRAGGVLLPDAGLGGLRVRPRVRHASRCRSTTATPTATRSTSRCCGSPAAGDRIGSLVVNPGGPGSPGTDYAANASSVLRKPLLEAYDVVGFDPRGTGESSPVDCLSDDDLDAYLAQDPDPDTAAEGEAYADRADAFAEGCDDAVGRARGSHLDRRGRPRHGRAAGGPGRGDPGLPRRVLRHQARRDVRRAVPRPGRAPGARRRRRRVPLGPRSSRSARPAASRRRWRPTWPTASRRPATASSATRVDEGLQRISDFLDELDAVAHPGRQPRADRGHWRSTGSSRRSTSATTGTC